jgi:1-acyl-sn-glycerol-3-phosphate acyltransferase
MSATPTTPWYRPWLRRAFALIVAWPVILAWLGINLRNRERLPVNGPAIVYANHNSHLDILALMTLFPLAQVPNIRPVAAADYFMKNPLMAWFSQNCIGIIAVKRSGSAKEQDPLVDCYAALERGEILVIFPEGTRGEPEQMAEFKSGIYFLGKRFPTIPIVPVFMYGLGKTMPKGSLIPVPFFVDIFVGKAVTWVAEKADFMQGLRTAMDSLKAKSEKLQVQVEEWHV